MQVRLRVNPHELRACQVCSACRNAQKSFPIAREALSYAAEKIRTPDTLVRSQVLYPAELRTHINLMHFRAMPATGIEPVLYRYNRILSPARLPVPPRRHKWDLQGSNL